MREPPLRPTEEIKACCAAAYESPWAQLLLGDSLHPGGPALTEHLGELLGLVPESLVLDVAAGKGSSALLLAERFGCQALGVDYGAKAVAEAAGRAGGAGLGARVRFLRGDAQRLALADASFDAAICECAFCTFPDKPQAAVELARVLRPGGKLGLADLVRRGPLPEELRTLLAWVACLGDARPEEEYHSILGAAGFVVALVESHDEALHDLVRDVRGKLMGAELLAKLGKLALPIGDFREAKRLARAATVAIDEGRIGYNLLVATRT